jgi:hypothetical protein
MITEFEAKKRVADAKKKTPYSCAVMTHFYVFCMEKHGTIFYAVDKKTGKVYPYSPGLDYIAYNDAVKHVYGD